MRAGAEVEFRLGEGWISGYVSALLGLAALGGVLCFLFPEYLTTGDLRANYDVGLLRTAIFWAIAGASVFGAANFLFAHGRAQASIGLAAAAVAVLCGGAAVETSGGAASKVAIGLDWLLLDLLVSALILVPLEKLLPLRRGQKILRTQWRTDLQYFVLTHLLISWVLLVTVDGVPSLLTWAVSTELQATVQSMPVWVQFLAAVLCADLAQYWVHRAYHSRAFWKFHAVHHSAPVMDWLAGSRLHVVEIVLTRAAVLVPLFLAGFSQAAVEAYIVLVGVQAVFIHANVGVHFGVLNYVLVTPQFHHWHHSDDAAATDSNFAVHLPVIDLLFGTFRLPAREWPRSYGVIGPPVPAGFVAQTLYPFRRGS